MTNVFIKKGAALIKLGDIVSFPTETVQGIGANALDDIACEKIFRIKNRPKNNPLIIHVQDINHAKEIVHFNKDAEYLAESLWPGPLTLILFKKDNSNISNIATSSLSTIAIRVPSHPIASKLIQFSGCPIAAPSANKSGMLSATHSDHVKDFFINDKLYIIPSKEKSRYGLESTIIDCTSDIPNILRHGCITHTRINHILKKEASLTEPNKNNIKSPGTCYKHYAPQHQIRLNATYLKKGEVGLNFGTAVCFDNEYSLNLSTKGDLYEAAHNLFDHLYKLDQYIKKYKLASIAIAPIPKHDIGITINDRLSRACDTTKQ
ncbi:L-threonylcarbamoyladenylate synthase [Rickettsia endosymbiont of Cardiosporidium cionae]|uniref:L-threonylcarbamoyladenylate synthase n=1 Tax=Rickettsia endosymbiont of Cardiosporidium cionae TaxID=2777155 RepID=UPI0018962F5A|nr:L-threonylcarbamoyladenylate synthase [Rickettsia endosymbiont of Cardiosporidium cionae]KAF8818482.1 threonylcarbamoyl-AMP synthase [Rickettsia endosymbiont of Cardiosporidium cionae]